MDTTVQCETVIQNHRTNNLEHGGGATAKLRTEPPLAGHGADRHTAKQRGAITNNKNKNNKDNKIKKDGPNAAMNLP